MTSEDPTHDAELALVGAMIAHPELFEEVPPLIPEPGILSRLGQIVYATALGAYEHHGTVDVIIVRNALPPAAPTYKQCVEYIAEALAGMPLAAMAKHYAEILGRRARRMEITNLASALQEAVTQDDSPARLQEHVEGLAHLVEEVGSGEPMQYLDLQQVMEEDPEPIPWLIPGWLAHSDFAMIAGEPGSGKSIFSMDMAIAIASGADFLGTFQVPEQRRVMYLDEEMPPKLAQYRLRKLIIGRELDHEQLELRYYNRQRINLDRPEARLALRQAIDAWDPQVIVLDSLVRFHDRDENSSKEMSAFYDTLRELGPEITWILLHHLAKPSKDKSQTLGHRVRGSSDLRAAMDQLYGLEGDSSTSTRTLIHDKNRHGETSLPVMMDYQENEARTSATLTGNTQTKDAEAVITELVESAEADGVARVEVVKLLDASGYKSAPRTASAVIGKLCGQGTLVRKQEGKGGRVRLWHKNYAPRMLDLVPDENG